ncbi:MAG: SCO family protein [Caldithrix sp.]|nr:MAG: SCO family protein [Caldithrix sp.]
MEKRRTVFWSVVTLCLFVLVDTGGSQILSSSARPDALADVGIEQRLDEELPLDLVFRDEAGREVQIGDYFGDRPVILSLVYYECPMLCTMVLNGLVSSLADLDFDVGNEFEVVTVSFNPKDTPDLASRKKQTYLGKYGRDGAEDGWHFLTGEAGSIEALTEAVGFKYKFIPETGEFVHASSIMVLTPLGKLSKYFYGIYYPELDLRLGLVEASDNKIGSPVDQILLYCYHYDPTTGKYGMVIMNVIRVAGTLTVLMLVGFMLLMFRRDRQRKEQDNPTETVLSERMN